MRNAVKLGKMIPGLSGKIAAENDKMLASMERSILSTEVGRFVLFF
jgi:hypothetical protein